MRRKKIQQDMRRILQDMRRKKIQQNMSRNKIQVEESRNTLKREHACCSMLLVTLAVFQAVDHTSCDVAANFTRPQIRVVGWGQATRWCWLSPLLGASTLHY